MSNQQLHKRISKEQVTTIFESYLAHKIELYTALRHLGIKRSRFFFLLKQYKKNPNAFTI